MLLGVLMGWVGCWIDNVLLMRLLKGLHSDATFKKVSSEGSLARALS